jgi:ubiquinone/menaquinone biosynthesis C-methylase UbiE
MSQILDTGLNAQFNVAAPRSLPDRVAGYMRRQMFRRFMVTMRPEAEDTLIDVGATSDETLDHSNYAVAWYRHKHRITAVGIDQAGFLERKYPGVTFKRASGLALPYADKSFDYGHSSAVLEHVGSFENQVRFIAELDRVSRKGVFLTTPNRWFPIEFHSVLPLVHWLPRHLFWRVLRATGRGALADEAVLNLMDVETLRKAARAAGVESFRIETARLFGWSTNLLLIIDKA